jgi:hypothetical protein
VTGGQGFLENISSLEGERAGRFAQRYAPYILGPTPYQIVINSLLLSVVEGCDGTRLLHAKN